MQIGQMVDFCISYNERQKLAEEHAEKKEDSRPKKRKATQAEINAYFGR